ncbi:MAG TPA: GAF domain-containing protein, partial [Candidatus Limnocylindrales bacterium]|nr:GAF domain-containing protein [Candidatus Limnocylindrales bacterium]
MTASAEGGQADRASQALREIALRVEIAGRLTPPGGAAVLRSVVEATVVLFGAEAASIALFDPATGRLVFEVAAGGQGEGVVGLSIAPDSGVAGYVFTTGQPLALSDVAGDRRFGRATAEQTGYVPRSLVAVPLLDDEGTIGVLEVLDKRDQAAFDLHDIELASVFARQAAVAIRVSRLERDTASLLRGALVAIAADASQGIDAVVAEA